VVVLTARVAIHKALGSRLRGTGEWQRGWLPTASMRAPV